MFMNLFLDFLLTDALPTCFLMFVDPFLDLTLTGTIFRRTILLLDLLNGLFSFTAWEGLDNDFGVDFAGGCRWTDG